MVKRFPCKNQKEVQILFSAIKILVKKKVKKGLNDIKIYKIEFIFNEL